MRSSLQLPPLSSKVSSSRYATLTFHPKKLPGLHVACIGKEECRPDYLVERKSFPCHAIELVIKGTGAAILNGHHYHLHPGTIFYYGPRTTHTIQSDSHQPMVKYFIDFFGNDSKALLSKTSLESEYAVQTLDIEGFQTIFEQIISNGSKMLPTSPEICSSYLRILILKAADAATPFLHRSSSASHFFHCMEFIDQHFHRLHNLDEICKELHMRPPHLCRLFQQFNKPSPYQYLIHKKMNRAAELLVAHGLSVKNTAGELGFDDPYHFSRVFKKHFGNSPQNFVKLSWRASSIT